MDRVGILGRKRVQGGEKWKEGGTPRREWGGIATSLLFGLSSMQFTQFPHWTLQKLKFERT